MKNQSVKYDCNYGTCKVLQMEGVRDELSIDAYVSNNLRNNHVKLKGEPAQEKRGYRRFRGATGTVFLTQFYCFIRAWVTETHFSVPPA